MVKNCYSSNFHYDIVRFEYLVSCNLLGIAFRSVFFENILKVNTMFDWKTYGYKLDVAGSQSYEQEIIFVLGLHFTHEISLLELFLMKKVDLYSYSNEKFMVLL